MDRWTYMVRRFDGGSLSLMESTLREKGNDGWELVSVTWASSNDVVGGWTCFLKRKRQPGE